jgi:ubiquitin-like-conjugating enzyme ATG10
MEASADGKITVEEYLTIWTGAMGKAVGLNMPLQLVVPNDA